MVVVEGEEEEEITTDEYQSLLRDEHNSPSGNTQGWGVLYAGRIWCDCTPFLSCNGKAKHARQTVMMMIWVLVGMYSLTATYPVPILEVMKF